MPGAEVKLNHAGIAEILKSAPIAALVADAAAAVAANVEDAGQTVSHGDPLPVKVDAYVTDRAASSVTLAHPAGLAVQAKHGLLTQAAAAAGLEVTEKAG